MLVALEKDDLQPGQALLVAPLVPRDGGEASGGQLREDGHMLSELANGRDQLASRRLGHRTTHHAAELAERGPWLLLWPRRDVWADALPHS